MYILYVISSHFCHNTEYTYFCTFLYCNYLFLFELQHTNLETRYSTGQGLQETILLLCMQGGHRGVESTPPSTCTPPLDERQCMLRQCDGCIVSVIVSNLAVKDIDLLLLYSIS